MGHKERMRNIIISIFAVALVIAIGFAFKAPSLSGFLIATESAKIAQENLTLEPQKQAALDALIRAEKDLQEIKDAGFSIVFANDTLIEAKEAFKGENYTTLIKNVNKTIIDATDREMAFNILNEAQQYFLSGKRGKSDLEKVIKLTDIISERKRQAYKISDSIRAAELKIQEYKKLGVNTTEALEILELIKGHFQGDRYVDAESTLVEIDNSLDAKKAELATLNVIKEASRTFLERNWKYVVIAAIAISLISFVSLKATEKIRAKKTLEYLKAERDVIQKLIEKAQLERFRDKKLSDLTYNIRMDEYRKRLNEVKGKIPVYEALAKGEKLKEK